MWTVWSMVVAVVTVMMWSVVPAPRWTSSIVPVTHANTSKISSLQYSSLVSAPVKARETLDTRAVRNRCALKASHEVSDSRTHTPERHLP